MNLVPYPQSPSSSVLKKRFFTLALWLSLAWLGSAAVAGETPWQAQWIGPASAGSNTWICLRQTCHLDQPPASLRARIAVDSKYWLWVNGKLLVFEGGLKRGPTPRDTYYDEVELAPALHCGDNTIAVLVWYWGKDGFSHNSSGQAGLVFDVPAAGPEWNSGAKWKMCLHPAYGQTGAPWPNFRLAEGSVYFDARRDIPDWTQPGFDDHAWPSPVVFGTPPCAPWHQLELRPIPPWKDSGLQSYSRLTTVTSNGEQLVTAQLPYNAQITPWFSVDAPAGERIEIQTDDYRGGGSPNVRSVYITRAGRQDYESLGWMNGHDVRYRTSPKVKFLEVKYRETGYNADFAGEFQCDDPALNTLWEKARRTLYLTMRDNYMDCPDRERAQWWGDTVNELGEAFYVFDAQRGPLLTRKAIRELVRWQRPDHTLYSPVPAGLPRPGAGGKPQDGSWYSELPVQMLASVSRYGFGTYYFYSGDHDTLALAYPAVRDYLRLWQQDTDGLVVHRAGDWDWEDWGKDIDSNILDSAWYELALQGAEEYARICGQSGDLADWQARAAALRKNFNAQFWNGREYRSPNYTGDTDDRANALAVVAGLPTPAMYPALREVLVQHRNASPYMEKYVLEALYQMDYPDVAMTRMKERWRDQIDSPLTTLWEGWGLGAKGFGGGTYNHAWSGGALTVLSQYAAGVAPEQPAYAAFHVLPQPGDLKFIHAVVPTPKGLVKMDFQQNAQRVEMTVEVPASTTAVIGLPVPPKNAFARITANGRTVWANPATGKAKPITGLTYLSADSRFVRFQAQPGRWRLVGVCP